MSRVLRLAAAAALLALMPPETFAAVAGADAPAPRLDLVVYSRSDVEKALAAPEDIDAKRLVECLEKLGLLMRTENGPRPADLGEVLLASGSVAAGFAEDGKSVRASASDIRARCAWVGEWRVSDGRFVRIFLDVEAQARCSAVSGDKAVFLFQNHYSDKYPTMTDQRIYLACDLGGMEQVRLEFPYGTHRESLQAHYEDENPSFSADHKLYAARVISASNKVRGAYAWNLENGHLIYRGTGQTNGVALAPEGDFLVHSATFNRMCVVGTGGDQRVLEQIDLKQPREDVRFRIRDPRVGPGGSLLAIPNAIYLADTLEPLCVLEDWAIYGPTPLIRKGGSSIVVVYENGVRERAIDEGRSPRLAFTSYETRYDSDPEGQLISPCHAELSPDGTRLLTVGPVDGIYRLQLTPLPPPSPESIWAALQADRAFEMYEAGFEDRAAAEFEEALMLAPEALYWNRFDRRALETGLSPALVGKLFLANIVQDVTGSPGLDAASLNIDAFSGRALFFALQFATGACYAGRPAVAERVIERMRERFPEDAEEKESNAYDWLALLEACVTAMRGEVEDAYGLLLDHGSVRSFTLSRFRGSPQAYAPLFQNRRKLAYALGIETSELPETPEPVLTRDYVSFAGVSLGGALPGTAETTGDPEAKPNLNSGGGGGVILD